MRQSPVGVRPTSSARGSGPRPCAPGAARDRGDERAAEDVLDVARAGLGLGAAPGDLVDELSANFVSILCEVARRLARPLRRISVISRMIERLIGRVGDHRHAREQRGLEVLREDRADLVDHVLDGGGLVGVVELHDLVGGEVAREDDDGVAEVDVPPLAVAEGALVEHLVEEVHHLEVGLLDLVEEHHGVGALAHGLGEHAALAVAHVARRRADEPGDRVLLLELAHVDGRS
jgi:hypothetical protein